MKSRTILSVTLVLATFCVLFDLSSAEYNCEYKKDGFYADDDFCHIYWRCNYGVAEEYECPAGTAWNHLEGRCDWLDNVDCTRVDQKGDKDKESDSDKEKEKNDVEETTKKPKKDKKQKSTTPDPNAASDSESDSKIAALKRKAILLSRKRVVTSSPNKTSSKQPEDLVDYDELCLKSTTMAEFREDPFICNKYIRCNHGYAQRFKCAKNTAWDVERKVCLWTEFVQCGTRELLVWDDKRLGVNDPDWSGLMNGTRPTHAHETTTTATPLETTTTTTTSIDTTTFIISETTGASTISNLFILKSDINDNNHAASTEKPSSGLGNTNNGASNVAAGGGGGSSSSSSSSSTGNQVCQASGSYMAADPNNCAAYYLCSSGKEPSKHNCGDKQLFNSETSQCDDFQQVFCGSRPVNLADRNQCQSKRDGIFPDLERGCRVFYQCINQQKVREANCPVNLKFNSLSSKCDNPANIVAPCGTYATSKSSSIQHKYWLIVVAIGLLTKVL